MCKLFRKSKKGISILALVMALVVFATLSCTFATPVNAKNLQTSNGITRVNGLVNNHLESYLDLDIVSKISSNVDDEDYLSLIVDTQEETLMEAYENCTMSIDFEDYVISHEAKVYSKQIKSKSQTLIDELLKNGIDFTVGEYYDTLLTGFEITVKAKYCDSISNILNGKANVMVSDEYEKCEYEVIENNVDVYETGIFDGSVCDYDGSGVVVAVLDTGLDYTHTAFSTEYFTSTNLRFTLDSISSVINQTVASKFTEGLTGEDVYVSSKVPFAYDYADRDPDVLPINSEHGTHVAGIIAGHDDEIIGVAPNAQLAIMKVFSDTQDTAKDSWIIAALEDCVKLGVDVINMSLGTACGFTVNTNKEEIQEIYNKIGESGISLIAAASNSFNATRASDKNGSNPLTSNPDSGTVGAPSTYSAALSVASVQGVKTPYLLYEGQIIYFTEASANSAKEKNFVNEILDTVGADEYEFEYVTINGVGRSSDYIEDDYSGRIVLVKRGETTFEDKVRVALKEKNASGIIIYNNISGAISMSVGADVGAVCSITQDDGELLAKAGTGKIKISRNNVSGPFMSDFSSWGPTSSLEIKPEITAHGGQIYSAVPGQSYDRLSGTSMAAPNQAGAVALIRQYVIENKNTFGITTLDKKQEAIEVTAMVNRLMMSTADIIKDKNGLPSAVRKQGAGLINIKNSVSTPAYISTYNSNGLMDKTKLELGDDKEKTGEYEMSFYINNISNSALVYDIDVISMTEALSKTYTSHSDLTVALEEYLLSGATVKITSINGEKVADGTKSVSVAAGKSVKVTLVSTLSQSDKDYLDNNFENGMYVEGFVKLTATQGTTINLNIPFLTFYGDWTQAPIFDEEYYDTNKDELNKGLDEGDKLMEDAYATKLIGSLYSDYICYLGSYYFKQDEDSTPIAANKDYVALSNQNTETNWTINKISDLYAGLLRNVRQADITIYEASTGNIVYQDTKYNIRKSYSSGDVLPSVIEIDYSAIENNLKNNTKYYIRIETYIDYGENEDQKNERNVFESQFYVDFEAPLVTNVEYRTEYDKTTKKTRLFADISIYDNHYAMSMQVGVIQEAKPNDEGYKFEMLSFGKYMTPIYSSYNSTTTVIYELTDYINQIKSSTGLEYTQDGYEVLKNTNSFTVSVFDYALNSATYELKLPDEVISMYFTEDVVNMNPNTTKTIKDILNIYPSETWYQVLNYESNNPDIADIVNQTIIAKASGDAIITVKGKDANGVTVSASLTVHVLSQGEDGYRDGLDVTEVNNFSITGYYIDKAYYSTSSDEREMGYEGQSYEFGGVNSLTMFPSETVTLNYTLDSNFPSDTTVKATVGNKKVAKIVEEDDGKGNTIYKVVAQAKGNTIVTLSVYYKNKSVKMDKVSITVKDPFKYNAIYLMYYRGLGGEVEIPGDKGITEIYQFAFSNYEYVDKDLEAGDVINDEDPLYIKPVFIGEDTITKVIIPEGVTQIDSYAFAGLTALEEVVLPTTLTRIGVGAFWGCTKLTKINLDNVQFINQEAFYNCPLTNVNTSSWKKLVVVGIRTFKNTNLSNLYLPSTTQSIGEYAFHNCTKLDSIEFKAEKVKIGKGAFANCSQVKDVVINASVISAYAFDGCSELTNVTLGSEVAVIGEYAFRGTKVAKFNVSGLLRTENNGATVYKDNKLLLVAPTYSGTSGTITITAEEIDNGAFSGNTKVTKVIANNVTKVSSYAFAGCNKLTSVVMPNVQSIDSYAFFGTTHLTMTFNFDNIIEIGDYAFFSSAIGDVSIPNDAVIGDYAFAGCTNISQIIIGNNVEIGEYAFYQNIDWYNYESMTEDDIKNLGYKIDYAGEEYLDYVSYFTDNYTMYNYSTKNEQGEDITRYYLRYNLLGSPLDCVDSNVDTIILGDNVIVKGHAFEGNAKLNSLVIGQDACLGEGAFYNCCTLDTVDLSKVLEIGKDCFSGNNTIDFELEESQYKVAYVYEYYNEELLTINYKYTSFSSKIESVNLANCKVLGEYAFAGNTELSSVTLGDKVDSISAYAFANCDKLTAIDFNKVTEIGEGAFANTSLEEIDLSLVELVGKGAFMRSKLIKVTFDSDVTVREIAFEYNRSLSEVVKQESIIEIYDYAFGYTALETANLSRAVIVGNFVYGYSKVTNVIFGDNLLVIGENPFVGCEIETFGKKEDVLFNESVVDSKLNTTYDISSNVKVIDDALYMRVSYGYQLVSYPKAKDRDTFVVYEGAVRISARAFEGSKLSSVELPWALKAIGDKAFYKCNNLELVVFTSFDAPILEEEYDISNISLDNIPVMGYFGGEEGLAISQYFMWNLGSKFNNFYMGANFVDLIGHITDPLIMVMPANGNNYDSFIFSQYFSRRVQGENAMNDNTYIVYTLIDTLPSVITINDEYIVTLIRDKYENLGLLEQQALVSNYTKLTDAEYIIKYLKMKQQDDKPKDDDNGEVVETNNYLPMILIIVGSVALLACAGVGVYLVIKKKNKGKSEQ